MDFIPETAQEALERWDRGDPVITLKTIGIGPAHEQNVHVSAFELIRTFLDKALDKQTFDTWD